MFVQQRTGGAAIMAIIAAIGGFFATFTGHPLWGLIIALVAIPLGIAGLVRATSPRVSGGVLSIVALVAAGLGAIFAVLVMLGMLLL
jgi:hypothetical protein